MQKPYKFTHKLTACYEEELENRQQAIARLVEQDDISSHIEADRLAKQVAYLKLALAIWG